jgi:hypothetical protein
MSTHYHLLLETPSGNLSQFIVRAGMVAKPGHYQWSSYQSYIGQCATPEWLKTDFILGYFGG